MKDDLLLSIINACKLIVFIIVVTHVLEVINRT